MAVAAVGKGAAPHHGFVSLPRTEPGNLNGDKYYHKEKIATNRLNRFSERIPKLM